MTTGRHLWQHLSIPQGVVEIGSIIVLSLATVASAWCGYQSALWSGIQTFKLHETERLERDAAQHALHADQLRMVDAALLVQYLTADARGDTALANLLRERFRPEATDALNAWLATEPLENPNAPAYPFMMPEYRLAAEEQAQAVRAEATIRWAAAHEANARSDNYVLLTVLFSTVLFFTGICSKLPSLTMQRATLGIGVALFIVGVVVLLVFPIA